ncbi:TIGR04255 family protein [Rhizobium ecuadorense]|uniref:TIGR04255 family protein n=1 Tax=Rhizobium ecuadorense TaxID=1671795 RepID=UPI000A5CEBB5|nr:TIGR04255 family protein [Rhizobium ecuadorense]
MAFDPVSGDHAIAEVVFGLSFSRPFAAPEIERVARSHSKWKADLPRLNRTPGFPFMIGNNLQFADGIQFGGIAGGVSFERIKTDGSLDWRVLVDQNNIFVNCLSYTRWAEIWPRAAKYMQDVIGVAGAADALVSSATLQYVDIFKWTSDVSEYNARQVMKPGQNVPPVLFDKGPFWHLHQGWFEPADNGRVLSRVHIDAVQDDEGIPIVKFDTYMQHQLATFYTPTEAISGGWIESTFASMHDKNKILLASFITDEMATRINLNVA